MNNTNEAVLQDLMVPRTVIRSEFGHTFMWQNELGFWYSVSGKMVMVFPPNGERTGWSVFVPLIREAHCLEGDGMEGRAFAIAAGYITQSD